MAGNPLINSMTKKQGQGDPRFGRFGGNNNYNWSYKGGAKNGRNFPASKNIFAIPADQVRGALVQNPGY